MFSCTKTEARRIAEGKAVGVTRRYEHGDCPHKVGNDIVFTGNFFRGYEGQQVPFARGKIVSVRPGTVGQFRNDEMLAYQDGFSTSPEWHGHINLFLFSNH